MALLSIERTWNATQDALAIWDYVAKHSTAAADRMLARFDRTIEQLSRNPELGERDPRVGDLVRRVTVGKYLIFYEVRDDVLNILRIMHSARNWEELL